VYAFCVQLAHKVSYLSQPSTQAVNSLCKDKTVKKRRVQSTRSLILAGDRPKRKRMGSESLEKLILLQVPFCALLKRSKRYRRCIEPGNRPDYVDCGRKGWNIDALPCPVPVASINCASNRCFFC